jgi:hypothetical protein
MTRADRRREQKAMAKNAAQLPRMDTSKVHTDPEMIMACALVDAQGNLHHGFKSHSDLRVNLGRDQPYTADVTDTYGFWTSNNRFVTREQAKEIGVASGQLTKQWLTVGRDLLSSDIW